MSLHTNLPIFAEAYQLLNLTVDLCANLPRKVKPLWGAQLQADVLAIADLIRRANMAAGEVRGVALGDLIGRLQQLELMFRNRGRWIANPAIHRG